MPKVLKLTFKFDGTVEKETSGYTGKSCAKDTEWVEKLLGQATDRKWKPEAGLGYAQAKEEKKGLERS